MLSGHCPLSCLIFMHFQQTNSLSSVYKVKSHTHAMVACLVCDHIYNENTSVVYWRPSSGCLCGCTLDFLPAEAIRDWYFFLLPILFLVTLFSDSWKLNQIEDISRIHFHNYLILTPQHFTNFLSWQVSAPKKNPKNGEKDRPISDYIICEDFSRTDFLFLP